MLFVWTLTCKLISLTTYQMPKDSKIDNLDLWNKKVLMKKFSKINFVANNKQNMLQIVQILLKIYEYLCQFFDVLSFDD